jgi:hypothetical protein
MDPDKSGSFRDRLERTIKVNPNFEFGVYINIYLNTYIYIYMASLYSTYAERPLAFSIGPLVQSGWAIRSSF